MCKVSVIVPVYNTALYLRECLDSICGQTLKDIEIICVNDGSTDDSASILKEYEGHDSRIRVINRDIASGSAAVPRNQGLACAQGKYVLFFDSDDYMDIRMLENMFSIAEKNDSDLVLCSNYRVNVRGEIVAYDTELYHQYIPQKKTFSFLDIPNRIFQISGVSVWNRLIRRELVIENDVRFQENAPSCDDVYFVCALQVFAKRISIDRSRNAYYRANRTEAQTLSIEHNFSSVVKAYTALFCLLEERNIYEIVRISFGNRAISSLLWWYWNIADEKIGMRAFEQYQNDYFPMLALDKLKVDEIDKIYVNFWRRVMRGEYYPPLMWVLNEGLPANSKIVLYGAGRHGRNVHEKVVLVGRQKIVLWCDKNYSNLSNPEVQSPDMIREVEYDAVLIAVTDYRGIQEIREFLKGIGVRDNQMLEV